MNESGSGETKKQRRTTTGAVKKKVGEGKNYTKQFNRHFLLWTTKGEGGEVGFLAVKIIARLLILLDYGII